MEGGRRMPYMFSIIAQETWSSFHWRPFPNLCYCFDQAVWEASTCQQISIHRTLKVRSWISNDRSRRIGLLLSLSRFPCEFSLVGLQRKVSPSQFERLCLDITAPRSPSIARLESCAEFPLAQRKTIEIIDSYPHHPWYKELLWNCDRSSSDHYQI